MSWLIALMNLGGWVIDNSTDSAQKLLQRLQLMSPVYDVGYRLNVESLTANHCHNFRAFLQQQWQCWFCKELQKLMNDTTNNLPPLTFSVLAGHCLFTTLV